MPSSSSVNKNDSSTLQPSYDDYESDYDSEEDDDDEHLANKTRNNTSYSSSSDLKQHAVAVLIAVIASTATFYHTSSSNASFFAPSFWSSNYRHLSSSVPHHAAYRRTAGLRFCHHNELNTTVKPGLTPFDFRLPKALVPTVIRYYRDDEKVRKEIFGGPDVTDQEHACLLDLEASSEKKFVVGYAAAYLSPDIASFYRVKRPSSEKPGKAIKKVDPSFTGFAAKFYNLSPKSLDLYWDGGSGGNSERKLGEVKPFEAIGTATFPGQTFRFSPTYDKEHSIKRFVVTADDAVVSYDPIKESKTDVSLPAEKQQLYEMAQLNFAFEKDYMIKTGRQWLAQFPRPPPMHHMWNADYFSHRHVVHTRETHFISVPENMRKLTHTDYAASPNPYSPQFASHRKIIESTTTIEKPSLNLTLRTVSCTPRVFEIRDFLSAQEADHLVSIAKSSSQTMRPSTTYSGPNLNGEEDPSVRRSNNTWIYRETDAVVDSVYRRAADVMKIDEALLRHRSDKNGRYRDLQTDHSVAEALQLVKYGEGEEYTAHHDFHYGGVTDRFQPSRFATLLIYLNDGSEEGEDGSSVGKLQGGDTVFPRAVTADSHSGVSVEPSKGKAVLFYNVLPDGNMDDLSQHAGGVVVKGEKWIANLWVWDPIIS